MRLTREKLSGHGLAVVAAAALLALTGCGGSGGGGGTKSDSADQVPATATGSLEDLAAEVKCKPSIQTDADEIRQAICKNPDGKFVLATFATDRGQREWINDAKDYGGSISSAPSGSPSPTRRWSRRCAASSAGPWRRGPRTTRAGAVVGEPRPRTPVTAADRAGSGVRAPIGISARLATPGTLARGVAGRPS